jgi:hypothetical protein
MIYQTPDNLVALLDKVVRAASRTRYYSPMLAGRCGVRDLDDFARIPVTPLAEYRKQRLRDAVAEPSRIEWILGPYRGQSPGSVAVAEGADEGGIRYDVFMDALKDCSSFQRAGMCALVASPAKRYFAAEVATIMIRAGIPSHVFIDRDSPRTYERLHHMNPELLVILSDDLAEAELPDSVQLCVTFRRSQRIVGFQQLDLYFVDELGFLGHSTDCDVYALNKDVYYFETSENGCLVATALHNRVQPMLRIETMDEVKALEGHTLKFVEMSASA